MMRRVACAAVLAVLAWPSAGLARDEISMADRPFADVEPADPRQHPWQVFLSISVPGEVLHCGGAVVAPRWVVTAASCLHPSVMPADVAVRTAGSGRAGVRRIVVHEEFRRNAARHDIALLHLASNVADAAAIALPSGEEMQAGALLDVARWAPAGEDGAFAGKLYAARVPYAETAACNARDIYNGMITDEMLCAGHADGGTDACQGDAGGPLVRRRPEAAPVLVGIVAWTPGCARKLRYGAYTRVASFAGWIERVIAGYDD